MYDAMSGIDEKYLSDSENFSEISSGFKRAKVKKISTVSSLCGCSLILAAAVFLNADAMKNNFDNVPELIDKSDTVQTDISGSSNVLDNDSSDISDVIITTDDKTEIKNMEDNTSGTNSEHLTPTENPDNDDLSSEDPVESPKEPISPDNYDKINFSGISVDEWLGNPNVIWDEADTKSYLNSEYIQLGNTKISDKLSDLMQNDPDNAVYAVMVDFSSCIDENELLNWKYNGNTIADLKLRISEATKYSDNSYTYVGSDGIEHIEYFLTSESEAKVAEIERKINEIKSAYRDAKIQEFRYSFNDNGLEVYANRISGIQEENFCFYTFATQNHLEEFKCKNNEAFIFYPANYFK